MKGKLRGLPDVTLPRPPRCAPTRRENGVGCRCGSGWVRHHAVARRYEVKRSAATTAVTSAALLSSPSETRSSLQ